MPIIRHGYATTTRRNGSTRAYRTARDHILANATHCHICGQPPTLADPLETDHVVAHADGGPATVGNLRPAHRSCNRRRGRGGGANT